MKKKISILFLTALLGGASIFAAAPRKTVRVEASVAPGSTYTNHDGATYYANIEDDLAGSDLLNALNSLNTKKRKTTMGKKAMLSGSVWFKYTDYYPDDDLLYDEHDQPYSLKLTTFYSGNAAKTGMNREHVWPDSRGGNLVEADIHMLRPTLNAENGSRGNSFYVEGMKDTKSGWDPAMESFGDESYRGDSARIIFYCAIANKTLTLVDTTNDDQTNKTMGKLSDMLKWNLKYPVQQREMNRNEGSEYLQGNRNPFIDHPEYACKIWGNTNSDTQQICSAYLPKELTIREDSVVVSESTIILKQNKLFNAYASGELVSDVTWSLEKEDGSVYLADNISVTVNEGTASVYAKSEGVAYLKAKYTYELNSEQVTIQNRIKITAKSDAPVLTSISVSNQKTEYQVGDSFVRPTVTAHLDNGETMDVSDSATFTGFDSETAGQKTITVSFSMNNVTKEITYQVTVSEVVPPPPGPEPTPSKGGCGGEVLTTSLLIASISIIGISLIVINRAIRRKKATKS